MRLKGAQAVRALSAQRSAPSAQRPALSAQRPALSAQRPALSAQRPAPSAQRSAPSAQRPAAHSAPRGLSPAGKSRRNHALRPSVCQTESMSTGGMCPWGVGKGSASRQSAQRANVRALSARTPERSALSAQRSAPRSSQRSPRPVATGQNHAKPCVAPQRLSDRKHA